ncbi:hypothetical protein [Arthrobacter koreensis]|uniref:hypothetical protein n=1 Tax=Arthrobacter koreensis TaxID=199136 RepID=UPI002DBC1ED2|nr:hypothetical protein [Arthrobacter koreensis]MEB7505280.1 endonuclease domain-containing protein [Arthrobacter koreensis]
MRTPKPLPPSFSEPFLAADALQAGLTEGRLRASDLRIPSRGIRVPRALDGGAGDGPAGLAARARPYLQLLPDAVLSHTSAALLHGIPLPAPYRDDPVLHLARGPDKPGARRRNVRCHRLALTPEDVVLFQQGLSVTSPARTWFDLARLLPLPAMVAAGDWLVSEHGRSYGRPRTAVVSLAELRERVLGWAGNPGIRAARRALELLCVGVDSPPETYLRLMLHDAGLPAFHPNFALLDDAGRPVVWSDLGCPEFRTCVEYDGEHHLTREQQLRDHNRDLLVSELGWHQVKVSALDMRRGSGWVAGKVARGLKLGGWTRSAGP